METDTSSVKTTTILRWIARILGTLLVAGFLFLFLSDVLGKSKLELKGTSGWLMFVFFMLGQAGLLLAWRWEGLGGLLAAVGIVAAILLSIFWVDSRDAHFGFMFWLIPTFLHLYCWRKSAG